MSLLGVERSGYYACLKHPLSERVRENARMMRLSRASFKASQGVYSAPPVFLDPRDAGETCSKHRVARFMREKDLRAVAGHRTRRYIARMPAELIPNLVKENFNVSRPDRVWVTDTEVLDAWLFENLDEVREMT